MADAAPTGFLLSDDLLDGSRVTATARAVGHPARSFRSADSLLAAARQQPPSFVLVDLHNTGLDIVELVNELGALTPRPRVIGYGSHVDAARLRAARECGCDLVLPRSQFFGKLEEHLAGWMTQVDETDERSR